MPGGQTNIYLDRESELFKQFNQFENSAHSYDVPYRPRGAIKQAATQEDIYDDIELTPNICYQVPSSIPARAEDERQVKLHTNTGKMLKVKISFAAIALVAVLTVVLVLLAVIVVAILYSSASSYRQESQSLRLEIEKLRAQVELNSTVGK